MDTEEDLVCVDEEWDLEVRDYYLVILPASSQYSNQSLKTSLRLTPLL